VKLLRHRLALRVALAALALALLGYGLAAQASKVNPAPSLPTGALQGNPVTVGSLRGHAEAIVFFASWCGPCRKEASAAERFATSRAGRGRVLGVDDSDFGSGPRNFLRTYSWTFPVLRDPDGTVSDSYGVASGLPTWVFINPRGNIVERISGPQSFGSLTRYLRHAA